MPTYAIGDVQGCYDELCALLKKIHFDPSQDLLWFVGDLVNRGPGSLETLRYVRSLGKRAVSVLGNHDLHLIALACGYGRVREDDTLDAVLRADDADEIIDWMRTLPMIHVEHDYVMVHAGLLPQWTVPRAVELAREVEQALRGPEYRRFLAHLYGSEPDGWAEELRGADRLRVIVNAMTRMRFCSLQGRMEFRTKGESTKPPEGYLPWFDVPQRQSRGSIVVCGHWSALGLKIRQDLIALDAGCVWGGELTAIRIDDGRIFQVPSQSRPRH